MRAIMIASGYYDAQWRKYESGSSMNVASLMRVALALKVSLGELLDGLVEWPRLDVSQIRAKHGAELDSDSEPETNAENEPLIDLEDVAEEAAMPPSTARPRAVGVKQAAKQTRPVKKSAASLRQTTPATGAPRKRKS